MSRQQSVLRNTVGYMLNYTDNQTTDGEEKSKPEVIKLGLDLHARQVTECRQLDGSTPKPAQQWDPWKLLDKVEEWVKAGIKVYSCYEAGPCGYWYHRELTKRGAVNYVVAPQLLENQRTKRQKTDRLDARSLLGNLESYLRGNRDAMSIIAVPSPLQEQQRSVVRYREQLMRGAAAAFEDRPGCFDITLPAIVAKDSIMADAHESRREDMQAETPDELQGAEG
jgi:hypothetical protein